MNTVRTKKYGQPLDLVPDLVTRLRRRAFLRAINHNPTAPNCRWSQPWDYILRKQVCQACVDLDKAIDRIARGAYRR